ncbi:alpha/beta hydrolase [Nakamurella sp. GG22]
MAQIEMDASGVRIALTRGDRWVALLRRDVIVPWDSIRDVEVVAEPMRLVRGLRAPGLSLPGRTKIGIWRKSGRKTLAVTRRGRPGLRLRLRNHGYEQILLSVPDGAGLADRIGHGIDAGASGGTGASGRPAGTIERPITFLSDGVPLGGTVQLPAPGRPVAAAAVIVTGSGRLDRDANERRAPLTVSRDLAAALAGAGVASLRYDKRGVGASAGDYLRSGVEDNIADARSALSALAAQPECTGVPTVLIGHSEGAMIATAVAADSDPGQSASRSALPTADQHAAADGLAGVILLAGPAKTGEQTVIWQAQRIAPALPKVARAVLKMLRTTPEKQQRKALRKITAADGDVARMQGVRVSAKWFREFLAFDPVPLLARITVPVLAITGDKDLQVDPDDLDVIAETVPGPVTVDRVPNLSHILRRDPNPPTLGDYRRQMREPVDAVVLEEIARWITDLARSDEPTAPSGTGAAGRDGDRGDEPGEAAELSVR